MGKWSDEIGGGNYVSTKVGTNVTVEIIDILKVTNKPEFEPKNKENVRQGFLFEFVCDKGTISVSTYALQSALKASGVDKGDTININHEKHGEYIVSIVKKAEA